MKKKPIDLGAGLVPPTLSASARPIESTTVDLVTNNIPAGTTVGAVLISFIQDEMGTDLAALGLAGCNGYIDPINSVSLGIFIPGGATSATTPYFVTPGFSGAEVYFQSAMLVPSAPNDLGGVVSNGLAFRFGDL